MKKITIITVTKNNANGLSKVLKQIKSLKEKSITLEFIVVDGASTDNTCNILRQNEDVDKWVSEDDDGIYQAMNKGIMMSSGDFIYFLNTGDELIVDQFIQALNIIEENEVCLPTLYYFNVYHVEYISKYCGHQRKIDFLKRNICHQSIIYSKSLFEVIGLYRLDYKYLSDYEHNIRCFGSNKINKTYRDITIAIYEGNGLSSKIHDLNFKNDFSKMIRKNFGYQFWGLLKIKNSARAVISVLGLKKIVKKYKLIPY